MKSRFLLVLAVIFIFSFNSGFSQLDLQKYKDYLNSIQNLNSQELLTQYPAGIYRNHVQTQQMKTLYMDSLVYNFGLTDYEAQLLYDHNFVVTERVSYPSFVNALDAIWQRDMPLFITSDMILHALHRSYDNILKQIEESVIIEKLVESIGRYYFYADTLFKKYADNPGMSKSVNDYDVYFTVACNLFDKYDNQILVQPRNPSNLGTVSSLLQMIAGEKPVNLNLFADTPRFYDFSQFTPRGHYVEEKTEYYFKTMIWLGRTEFYLIPPEPPAQNPITLSDVQRQIIDACLIREATNACSIDSNLKTIDDVLSALIGQSDNVRLDNMAEVLNESGISDITMLLDTNNVRKFQKVLLTKSYADQKILSQMIWDDPGMTNKIKAASAFLLMGQRFIIDSYIFSNLVHDKVPSRMLPSSLDILFSMGNNAAGKLLQPEIDYYNYGKNIAALRYLVESNDKNFWLSSLYNSWLNSIRQLNPPTDSIRKKLPQFMQTAAWWQEKMNTQLASWTELRHDNLLYAKQSYSGMASCAYPYGYVEPVPAFYQSLNDLAKNAGKICSDYMNYKPMINYFDTLAYISGRLTDISTKELNGTLMDSNDKKFIQTTLYSSEFQNCDGPHKKYDGWYIKLNYLDPSQISESLTKPNYIVADVHTAPTDADGNMVGWVTHSGTGKVNMMIVNVENWDGTLTIFCGPVYSYLERLTTGFVRLTDEDWKTMYTDTNSIRPNWVDLYLARNNGKKPIYNPLSLPTGINEPLPIEPVTAEVNNYPNPFSESTFININLKDAPVTSNIRIDIFDLKGNLIKSFTANNMPVRNYIYKWDGCDNTGKKVNSGTYIFSINVNNAVYSGKMILEK